MAIPISIFLEQSSVAFLPRRQELATTFTRAGFHVFPEDGTFRSPEELRALVAASFKSANLSVHILTPEKGPLMDPDTSIAEFQLTQARQFMKENPGFKIVVWLSPDTDLQNAEPSQKDYINKIRNSIGPGMIFSNASSSLQLVDDIRSLMEKKEQVVFDLKNTDVFLISNQLDEMEAEGIKDLLSDIVPVENLNIVQDSDIDYSEFCKQQIQKCKLAVVYFKMSGDWAVPFTQQVWKKIGGAATHTPILLIGDDDPDTNMGKKFVAPKVISLILAGDLIPLEIKVQFDKIIGAV